ncbi:MAG: hypothetical protein RMI94_06640 [Bryobacterales bacterium]|nr:hypothetical protein [Bryobacteraceae bacterium]MDW8130209.1 hypothetical protein [Bryobacterales bacterium]
MNRFCPHCDAKAHQRRIALERAGEGFRVLGQSVRARRAGQQPVDGRIVAFLGILIRYPRSSRGSHCATTASVNATGSLANGTSQISLQVQVGWHISHNNWFRPFHRSQQDLQPLANCSDFPKIVMVHNAAEEHMATSMDSIQQQLIGDPSGEQAPGLHCRMMNCAERGYEQTLYTGFSADYVPSEARWALAGLAGSRTQISAGTVIEIPTKPHHSRSTPSGTKAAVLAALCGAAHGLLLPGRDSGISLANLAAAGEAVREFVAT